MKNIYRQLRSKILVWLTHGVALPLLKKIRKTNPFPYNMEDLRKMPEGVLGNDLAKFLESRKLPILPHYARHDMKHVLLGYDTTDKGEAMLQAFMLGNGRISFPVLATVFYASITMPEYWNEMRAEFNKGKNCPSIHNWNWTEAVHLNTQSLREKIFNS